MQKIEPSLKTVTNTLTRRHWLELAEYASIAGSAVGTLAAALSQQFVFAAAPLTLAVSLNLINRSRITQQQLSESPAANSLSSSFDDFFPFSQPPELFETTGFQDEIAELKRSVTELQESTMAAIVEVRQQLAEQQHSVSHTEAVDLNPIYQTLSQLQGMTERLQNSVFTEDDWERLNVQLLLLQESITEVRNTTAELQQQGSDSLELTQIESAIAQMLSERQMQSDELLHRVEQLEHKNREIIRPYLQRLVADVKQLQKQSGKAGHS